MQLQLACQDARLRTKGPTLSILQKKSTKDIYTKSIFEREIDKLKRTQNGKCARLYIARTLSTIRETVGVTP